MITRSLIFFFITGLLVADTPEQAVEKAHNELWRRFVDEHNLILDYVGLKGEIVRPTPEDCREMKPSALSWGVPNEDGPMFNGLYLDALCSRWLITKDDEVRAKARRLIDGLIKVSTIGKTPGFIARGIATDGKTTYPMGSNDQTTPWLYGIWRYVTDGLPKDDAERQDLVQRFIEQVKVLDGHAWKVPTDGPPSPYRGDFAKPTWEAVPRLLFIMKAMHTFTGDASWKERYLAAAHEKVGKGQRERLAVCRIGMIFDPGQGERHSWTGSESVICLRGLWEMETDSTLKNDHPPRRQRRSSSCRQSNLLACPEGHGGLAPLSRPRASRSNERTRMTRRRSTASSPVSARASRSFAASRSRCAADRRGGRVAVFASCAGRFDHASRPHPHRGELERPVARPWSAF
jgi:hypothetical protein